MKTDKRVTEALARVNVNEPRLLEWLKDRLERHQDQMGSLKDDVEVRWAQGRVQETKSLIKSIESAAEILRKADQ